ncbi:MAG: AAA family ATPase, partial [Defluviitaleaceae bacterium]|nr:AAA family ATPase [Defluviitaleaceae bacterium]
MRKLNHTELKRFFTGAELGFADTTEIAPGDGLIGQGRGYAAFDFGLSTRMDGYNIYVCGVAGSGKTT